MMLAFTLTMPSRGSWDGQWSGQDNLYCIVKPFRPGAPTKRAEEILQKEPFFYAWDDGWTARVAVEEVDRSKAGKLRRRSRGFAGYDWMVHSIIKDLEILA